MPSHSLAKPLSDPRYEPFSSIGRCLHFEDFLSCCRGRSLVPHQIKSRPQYVPYNIQVLWFAPSKKPTEHNFYGNVTFSIPFTEVLGRFGMKFYYIDQSQYDTHMVTRILLSKSNLSYERVDYNQLHAGSPMEYQPYGAWTHAAQCNSTTSSIYRSQKPHELEIALHVTTEDCAWLFRKCKVSANNHSDANSKVGIYSFKPHICHRYNTFGRTCPYSLSNEVTVALLRKWALQLLQQKNGLVMDPDTLFRKVLADTVGRFGAEGEESLLQRMSSLSI